MAPLEHRYRLGIAAGVGVTLILGLLVLSTRFWVNAPSMVDDWYFASHSAKSLGGLLEPLVDPMVGRYRPAWNLWGEFEWHTFGAPRDLTGPNLWGAVRVLLFVGGVVLVPAVIAATSRPRPGPLGLAALAAAAGLLVFSGPGTDVSFVRLGPAEPILIGAGSLGAALILIATRRLIDRGRPMGSSPSGGVLRVGVIFVAGYTLWLLGCYQKEASICFLVLAPFLYMFLDRRWRDAGLIGVPLWRVRAFQFTAAAMIVPLLHLAVVTLTLSSGGASLYGASQPSGIGGWSERALDSLSFQWSHWPEMVGSGSWRIVALVVPALLGVSVLRWRRRVPWLPIGLVLTGWAILIFQGFPLHAESHYYIPSMALFAMAGVLLLAQGPAWLRWIGVAGAIALATANVAKVNDSLDGWSAKEADDAEAARLIAGFHPASCPVYMSNIDIERAESMPRVLGWTGRDLNGACRPGAEIVVVGLIDKVPGGALGTSKSMRDICAERSVLIETGQWKIVECRRLRSTVDGIPVKDILRPNRLVPGIGPFALHHLCIERYDRSGCGLKG